MQSSHRGSARAAGPRRVVTGTFHHSIAEVLDLHLEGSEPIGTTANHPFWSEDRQRFVPAIELKPGERLRALGGTPRVLRTAPRPHREAVYNLEIQVAHIYHVGSTGALVHNMCAKRKAVAQSKSNTPTLEGTPYHPDSVAARQRAWREAKKNHFARNAAEDLGFTKRIPPQKAPFNSHVEQVFSDGNRLITPDADSHRGGVWKMFNHKGERLGTFDENLNRIGG